MWRSVKSNGLCDLANLSWAKDAVLAQAVRELTYEAANTTSKSQQNRGCREQAHAFKCVWGPRIAGPMMPPQRVRHHDLLFFLST